MVKVDGIVLLLGQKMKTTDNEGYKFLGVLEMDKIKEGEIVDRVYVSRAKGEHGLISYQSCIRSDKNSFRRYLKNATEELLAGEKTVGFVETDETVSKESLERGGPIKG